MYSKDWTWYFGRSIIGSRYHRYTTRTKTSFDVLIHLLNWLTGGWVDTSRWRRWWLVGIRWGPRPSAKGINAPATARFSKSAAWQAYHSGASIGCSTGHQNFVEIRLSLSILWSLKGNRCVRLLLENFRLRIWRLLVILFKRSLLLAEIELSINVWGMCIVAHD